MVEVYFRCKSLLFFFTICVCLASFFLDTNVHAKDVPSKKIAPNCKIIVQSVINGAEFPIQNIRFVIALVDQANMPVNATSDITVDFSLTTPQYLGRTISPSMDYTSPTSNNVIIRTGESTATLEITVIDDQLREGPEQLTLQLTNTSSASIAVSTIMTESQENAYIIDNEDDSQANVSFSNNNYVVTIAIPEESNKGTLPSCKISIEAANPPDLLPTATTIGSGASIQVFPAFDDTEILEMSAGAANSAGEYTRMFYARNDLWQSTGQFTLRVGYAKPLDFETLNARELQDEDCNMIYALPLPGISTNPNCDRRFDVTDIVFDTPSVIPVDVLNREYVFPYGVTTGHYMIKERIPNCTECITADPIKIDFNITRKNIGAPVIASIPDLTLTLPSDACTLMPDISTLPTYNGMLGCVQTPLQRVTDINREFTKGSHDITYMLSNPNTGVTATAIQKLIIIDETPPVITMNTTIVTVTASTDTCFYSFNKNDITTDFSAMDNCGMSGVIINFSIAENESLKAGTHQLQVWAVDGDGNQSAQEPFTLRVLSGKQDLINDFDPQTIEVQLGVDETAQIIDWQEPIIDSCYDEGDIQITKSHQPQTSFMAGEYNVTYTYLFPSQQTIVKTLNIMVSPPTELKELVIYKIITPNGDLKNDAWVLENIEQYAENRVLIFNGIGELVFQQDNYDNLNKIWTGINSETQKKLNNGLYYYKIWLKRTNHTLQGSVMVLN